MKVCIEALGFCTQETLKTHLAERVNKADFFLVAVPKQHLCTAIASEFCPSSFVLKEKEGIKSLLLCLEIAEVWECRR